MKGPKANAEVRKGEVEIEEAESGRQAAAEHDGVAGDAERYPILGTKPARCLARGRRVDSV